MSYTADYVPESPGGGAENIADSPDTSRRNGGQLRSSFCGSVAAQLAITPGAAVEMVRPSLSSMSTRGSTTSCTTTYPAHKLTVNDWCTPGQSCRPALPMSA